MAALFTHDGSMVGFDGSQIDGGPSRRSRIWRHLRQPRHPAYVGKIREVRELAPKVDARARGRRHGAGGRRELNPRSTPSTRWSPSKAAGRGAPRCSRARRPRSTAGPISCTALTEELRELLPTRPPAAAPGAEASMSGVGNTAAWIAASRAKESELALPLFSDPVARELSGDAGFELQTD
jgi:hypothetical protein